MEISWQHLTNHEFQQASSLISNTELENMQLQ